jgi:hypothetical protein
MTTYERPTTVDAFIDPEPSSYFDDVRAVSRDLSAFRGRPGRIDDLDGLTVEVTITDARIRFGHLDLLVTPRSGRGQRWFESRRITFD